MHPPLKQQEGLLRDGVAMEDACNGQSADEVHEIRVKLKDETGWTNVIDGRKDALEDERPGQSVTEGIIVIQSVACVGNRE